jgi:hypothetical protein
MADSQALIFDLRRSSHSVGANVRDAAAYLLWSLSRACDTASIAPFASDLATTLISVACLDREVGVRRAASAAFQEGVGRLVSAIITSFAHVYRACILTASTYWQRPTSFRSVSEELLLRSGFLVYQSKSDRGTRGFTLT